MKDVFRLSVGESPSKERDSRLHVLKNLNILFQPMFAEAWVSEKMVGGIDTSVSLIERELSELRRISPFVRDLSTRLSTDPANVAGSNFSLIASQLHNKAGDLLFYKGRQRIPLDRLVEALSEEQKDHKRWGWEGYLLRAHYHYAVGLHELRRYLFHRVNSSMHKFNIAAERWPTFVEKEWPDFIWVWLFWNMLNRWKWARA
jgi:hypothetical protein